MKIKFLCFFILISTALYSQKESNITIDSGNRNDIKIIQEGIGDSQKSNINIKHADSNKTDIKQNSSLNSLNVEAKKGFWYYVKKFYLLIITISALITLIFTILKKIYRKRKGVKDA